MEEALKKLELGSSFSECEALMGITESTQKTLADNGVVTLEDFMLLNKSDLTELRSGSNKINMGQMNKLSSICRRVKAFSQPPPSHLEPPIHQSGHHSEGTVSSPGSKPSSLPAFDKDSQNAASNVDFNALLDGFQGSGDLDSAGITVQQIRNRNQLESSGKDFDLLKILSDHKPDPLCCCC